MSLFGLWFAELLMQETVFLIRCNLLNESMDVSVGLSSVGTNLGLALEDQVAETINEMLLSLHPVELAFVAVASQTLKSLEYEFK